MATTENLWNKSNKVGTSTGEKWVEACPISTLNSALNSLLPNTAQITNLKLHVTADFDCGMVFANVYLRYGWGGTASISKELLSSTKMTSTNELEYPSGGVDITSYLSSKSSPFALSTSNGSYLAFAFSSTNITSKTYKIPSVTLEVTYDMYYTISVTISPEGAGSVTGEGTYKEGSSAKLEATPNEGYQFVGWQNPQGNIESYNPLSFLMNLNWSVTALFEKVAINNISVNEVKPKAIYFDENNIVFVVDGDIPEFEPSLYDTVDGYHIKVQNTVPSGMTECKEVYRDLIKVYG